MIALCVNFIGDGLRDAFDPRQGRQLTKKVKKHSITLLKKGAKNE